MRIARKVLAASLAACVMASIVADDGRYWDRRSEGWFWYKDPPRKRAPDKPDQTRTPATSAEPPTRPKLAEHEALQRELRELRIVAIMSPTEENVVRYLEAQRRALDLSALFADQWQRTVWATAALDYGLRFRPVNSLAAAIHDDTQRKGRGERLRALAKTHGLALFFRGDCPTCDEMARTLVRLRSKHGIHVTGISVDGTDSDILDTVRPDNGIGRALGVQAIPSVHLLEPARAESTTIGHGLLSLEEIEERLDVLTGKGIGERF